VLFHLSILSEIWLLNFLRPCSAYAPFVEMNATPMGMDQHMVNPNWKIRVDRGVKGLWTSGNKRKQPNQDLNLFTRVSVQQKNHGKNLLVSARDISWSVSSFLAIVAALFRIAFWVLLEFWNNLANYVQTEGLQLHPAVIRAANYKDNNHYKHQRIQIIQYQTLSLKQYEHITNT
jgi:hypothetical protein